MSKLTKNPSTDQAPSFLASKQKPESESTGVTINHKDQYG